MVRYKLKPPNKERQKAFIEELDKWDERNKERQNAFTMFMLDRSIENAKQTTPYKDERWKTTLLVFGAYLLLVWLCR